MGQTPVIVSAVRTAVGAFGGSLKDVPAAKLAQVALQGSFEAAGIEAAAVEDVTLGCVGQYGTNAFLARIAALNAGCRDESTALTVNRLCASGLQGIVTAAQTIARGDAKIAAGGGAESMSNYPYLLNGARWGMRMGAGEGALEDSLTTALCEPFTGTSTHIAVTAENIARQHKLTREELDAYALESQRRALAAIDAGRFEGQIVPVDVRIKRETVAFATDENPRATTAEKLARLRPFAKADGVVTAGNASGINDGAAALVLMGEETAKAGGYKPLARLVGSAVAGVDPQLMGMGPVPATRKLVETTGVPLSEVGLFELNEAFAAQALACIRELGLDPAKVNTLGSGISIGHPIGATGAVITTKLLHEMRRTGTQYGVASLCIGGGQGMSALFELV